MNTYNQLIQTALTSLKQQEILSELRPPVFPGVARMFADTLANGLKDFRHPTDEIEEENGLKFAFYAGFMHGFQSEQCGAKISNDHTAEALTTLASLRTYAANRSAALQSVPARECRNGADANGHGSGLDSLRSE